MEQDLYSLKGKRVWVAGHKGMVGSAIIRRLKSEDCDIITVDRSQVDLTEQKAVRDWMGSSKPDVVFLAAAKVGGILANSTYPSDFLYSNITIEINVVESCYRNGVEKLLFLGSSCIYPKAAEQPIQESALLTGPLEETNEWYAIAKIAGIKMCQAYRLQHGCDFISAMPTNLYGPGDNFDLKSSHVLPALIRKAHEAKVNNAAFLTVWGSGKPLREFLHVDDCAAACVHLIRNYSHGEHVNVGSGTDISIMELAKLISQIVGYKGGLVFDSSKPDGTFRKLMDSSRMASLDWKPTISLKDGIANVYRSFLESTAAKPERQDTNA